MADFEKKVSLIEIQVDNTAAMAQVEALTESIIAQKKQVADNNNEIKALNKANADLAKEVAAGTKTQAQANKEAKVNSDRIKDLTKENFSLQDGLKELNAERNNAVKVSKLQSNSLDALRKKVSDQKKELNGLNTATEEGAKRFEELTAELKANNEQIKELDQAAGDFKTSIGDYTGGIIAATEKTGLFGEAAGYLAKAQAAMKSAQDALTTSTIAGTAATGGMSGALKILRAALISTGIGAIVVVLGSLISYLTTTQAGIDKVTSVTRPLIAIFEKMKGVIQDLGGNVFKGLAMILNKDIKGGLKALGNGFTQAFSDAKDAINEGWEAGKRLDELQKQIEKTEINLLARRDELNAAFASSKAATQDITKTEQERIAAAKEAIRLSEEQQKLEIEFIDLKIEKMKLEQSLNDTSRENEKELAALIAERSRMERDAVMKKTEVTNMLNGIEKASRDKTLANIKAVEAAEEKARQEKIKAEKEAAAELAQIEAKRVADQAVLNTKLLALEEFRRSRANEIRLREVTDIQENLKVREQIEAENFEIMQARIAEERAIALENDALSNEEKLAVEAEYKLQLEQLEAMHADNMIAIAKAQADEEKKIEAGKKAEQVNLVREGQAMIQDGIQISNNLIEGFYQKRNEDLYKQLQAGEITQEYYDAKLKMRERNKLRDMHKASVVAFRINQAAALVEIGIATAEGVQKEIGEKGIPAGIATAAMVAVSGLAQAAVVATKSPPPAPTFAQGGDVFGVVAGGNLHSNGGTKYVGEDGNTIEVERGEGLFVTKRSATNPALQLLNQANTANGGRSMFSGSSRYLKNGGTVDLNQGQDLTILAEAITNMPAPVVQVETIMGGMQAEMNSKNVGII